ncbi:MAG: hypothetical protein AMDU3_IPLC00002G0260 [Thermoplasmatales archaeon I-plasma]|jgi:hypothetical protein|nr:MAG: hypothetical protein AMDU3_IPLC00002G0260 [Thermoplasmatales archaeon I-plasma]
MIGIPWVVNLVMEGAEITIFLAILLSFVNTYRKNGQGVMIRLIMFSVFMVVFESLLVYITYFLSTRFGLSLASVVMLLNVFLIAALYLMLRVVSS